MSRHVLARSPGTQSACSRATIALAVAVVLTGLVIAASGCGTAGNPGDTDGANGGGSTTTVSTANGGGSTTTDSTDSISHPTGKNEIVLQISAGGGFVPVQYNYTMIPQFSLYGDGRVIVSGPVPAIYPGPALPNLQAVVVPEEALQAILSAAREAGLFNPKFDYGQPGITDVSTTTFVINADGASNRSEVYALGMEAGTAGLTLEQQQARAALQDFSGKLADLSVFVSGELAWEAYKYSGLAVYSQATDPSSTESTDVQPNRLDWPLSDLAKAGEAVEAGFRRVVVSGQDLEALRPSLAQATEITLWKSGSLHYHLFFRPLLPDETT